MATARATTLALTDVESRARSSPLVDEEQFQLRFAALTQSLWERHSESLTFQELRKGLQALSHQYTQKRTSRDEKALSQQRMGRGKQAAFALSFAPRHLLMVRHIAQKLRESGAITRSPEVIFDLGCGSGVASAGFALAFAGPPWPWLHGLDTSRTSLAEAKWLWRECGMTGTVQQESFVRPNWRKKRGALLLAGWAVNELRARDEEAFFASVLEAHAQGHPILIVEPIARGISPFWPRWSEAFLARGGRSDTWRHQAQLPGSLGLLSRAAGLDHRELTARSLWLPAR